MAYLPSMLSLVAAGGFLFLAALHAARGGKRPQRLLFVALAVVLCALQVCQAVVLLQSDPPMVVLWLQLLQGLTIFLPAVAIPFFMVFGKRDDAAVLKRRLPWIFGGLLVAGAAAILVPVRAVVMDAHFYEGRFWGVSVGEWGKVVGVYVVLANVGFLYMIENTYRAASIPEKVTLKYPLLGLVTSSIITLVVVSRVLAISVLDRNFLALHSAGLIVLCATLFFATLRYRLFDVQVYVGRQVTASVISVSIAGAYLVALAIVSYIARAMGLPYDRLTIEVLIVFAVFLIVAVLMSGSMRRRIRRFVDENFYLNRFDYRNEWRRFAHLAASSDRIDLYLTNFITAVCESMMVERGVVWVDIGGGLTGTYGLQDVDPDSAAAQLRDLGMESGGVRLLAGQGPLLGGEQRVEAVATLGSGEAVVGMIGLGGKSMGLTYSEEDRDFLAMLADQATLAIENYQLSEIIIDNRQIETFSRFASFVVHDLKNTVGMLSLTAHNARDNIGDAEFQRDTIETIQRSVAKMQGLIESLRALDTEPSLKREIVDVGILVGACVASLKSVARARGLSLHWVEVNGVEANIDRQAVERALENLVYNAMDASPAGGVIRVVVEEDGDWLRITVADSGSGFDPEYLRGRAFRPFQTTKKEGLGVGLLMCKTIAVAHGGYVHIDSAPGHGAEVSLILPLDAAES